MDFTPPITSDNIPINWNQLNSFTIRLKAIDYADTIHDTPSGVAATYYTTDGTDPDLSSPHHDNTLGDIEFSTEIVITGQGLFTIKFFSIDNNGNAEFIKTRELKLDNLSPISSHTVSIPPDGSDDWYKTNPTITISAADIQSGVLKTFYRWNSNVFQQYSLPFQIPSQGVHTLQYYSMDYAGNVEIVKTFFFQYDNIAPITEDDTPEGVQKEPVTIHFFYSDNVSGVKNTYYTTDGSTPTTSSVSGTSVTISETGTYTIKYFSVDFAGNQETVKQGSVDLFIDTEAPHVFISESFPINGNNAWYRSTPEISLSATDPSGISELKYKRFPTGATTTSIYTGTIDLSATIDLSTNYNIKLEIDQSGIPIQIDLRGSIAAQTTITEIINTINDAIGLTIASETNSSGGTGTGYITLKSTTSGERTSEIKFVQPTNYDATTSVFGLDTSYPHTFTELVVFIPYTVPFTLLYDDQWQVDFYATDLEGNIGETQTKQYQLDSTNPVTSALASYEPDGNNGWYITIPDIILQTSDNKSGVYKTFYYWDSDGTSEYISGMVLQIPSQGQHTLNFYSIDNAGNIETIKQQVFKYDISPPVTTDNTLELQGIIYTAICSHSETEYDENCDLIGTEVNPTFISSIVQTSKPNVKAIIDFFDVTKNQHYYVYNISGTDRDYLRCLPLKINENPTRLGNYQIQLNETSSYGDLLRSFDDVFRIYDLTNGTTYTIDPSASDLTNGILTLSGERPILFGDQIQVDYAYNGPTLSPLDSLNVDYEYDSSHEVDSLNTNEYTLVIPFNPPKIHDHAVTLRFTTTDSESSVEKTYFSLYGTDPKDGAYYTSPINLMTMVDLSINYNIKLEIDQSAPIEIDLRGAYPAFTTVFEIVEKINDAVGMNIATENSGFITLKSILDATDLTAEIRFDEPSEHDATQAVFGLNTSYPHIFKIYQGNFYVLEDEGTYEIKYYSVDAAGNIEDTKTAQYLIIIDKNIPLMTLSFLQDPTEDGENGWFKKNFRFKVDISTDDIVTRLNEEVADATSIKIDTEVNDKLDFEETNGSELFFIIPSIEITVFNNKIDFIESTGVQIAATVTTGTYTAEQFRAELETQLNAVGTSNYTVSFSAMKYTIASDLTGGSGIFEILWSSGINTNISLINILGFDRIDRSGQFAYTSDYEIKTFILYTPTDLATTLQTLFNGVGSSNYTVQIVGNNPSAVGYRFSLVSDVSGGAGLFSLTWQSGTHSIHTIGKNIGFDISTDDLLGSTYISDYFRVKVPHYFIVPMSDYLTYAIVNHTTHEQLEIIDVDKGGSGFYDEFIVNGTIPSSGELLLADYKHYVGIEKANFSLDSTVLGTSIGVYNDLDKFVSLDNDRANFRIIFPAVQGQFFLQEGEHTIFAKVYDYNSIIETGIPQKTSNIQSNTFKLDKHVPVTVDDITNVGWQQGSATITLTPTDFTPGSGISATHYTIDGNTPTRLSPKIQDLLNQKIIISLSGIYTIKYFSVDIAGNSEPVKTAAYQVFVDANAPETTIITVPSIPDGLNGWFKNAAPTVSFVVADYQSGVDKTYYKLPGELVFTEFTVPIVISTEASNQIQFYSVDNVGNIEATRTAYVKFDQTAPDTTVNIPDVGYSCDPVIVFTINDSASGGMVTYFTIDGTTPDYTSPIGSSVTFNSSGTYTIKFFSLDNAGNVESVKTKILYLDLEIPIITNFLPVDCLVDESTTQISFHIEDALSGVDISSIIFDVDGIEYSQSKNSSYFSYTGTPADYLVVISPIQDVLNFEDIELLQIKNVKDFAGNVADLIEYDFRQADITPPRVKEIYPIPNAADVSTNSNIIAFLYDNQSGVDIESVKIVINSASFSIVTNNVLKVQYIGAGQASDITVKNNTLRTTVDGIQDLAFSLVDENYNTIKKVNDYIDSLPDYTSSIIDSRFEQNESKDILNISNVDMKVDPILKLFIPFNNLNFSFIERENGYLVFATPPFVFANKTLVNVSIYASDNDGNVMTPFSYTFTPNVIAALSVKKRNYLNKTGLTFIEDIQDNIASNYTRSKSTHFYGHHKSIGKELSRVQEDLDHLYLEDEQFATVRSMFLYEKFGYLLETPSTSDLSHSNYRRLLLSLLGIFFQGSTKTSLEEGVSLFTGSQIQINEVVFAEGSDISEQFTFTADIILSDNKLVGIDLQILGAQLDHLFSLVKPAHVYILKRFIFSDKFAFQASCTLQWLKDIYGNYVLDQWGNKIPIVGSSGFQDAIKNAPTAICDRFRTEFEPHYSDDMRIDCSEVQETIQTIVEDVSVKFTGVEDTFTTYYKPLLKNLNPPEIAEATDVEITVNGIPVTILEFDPIEGIIKINVIPGEFDVVVATYFYNPIYIYRLVTFYLNDYVVDGNDFDITQASILNQQNVNDALGGFDVNHDLHAHVCETSSSIEVITDFEDIYEIPECNDAKFFYLNDYTVEGDDFDIDRGSYLNQLNTVNRSSKCPYLFLEIDEFLQEEFETIQAQLGFTLETNDDYLGANESSLSFETNYSDINTNEIVDTSLLTFELDPEETVPTIQSSQITDLTIDGTIGGGLTNDVYAGVDETSNEMIMTGTCSKITKVSEGVYVCERPQPNEENLDIRQNLSFILNDALSTLNSNDDFIAPVGRGADDEMMMIVDESFHEGCTQDNSGFEQGITQDISDSNTSFEIDSSESIGLITDVVIGVLTSPSFFISDANFPTPDPHGSTLNGLGVLNENVNTILTF